MPGPVPRMCLRGGTHRSLEGKGAGKYVACSLSTREKLVVASVSTEKVGRLTLFRQNRNVLFTTSKGDFMKKLNVICAALTALFGASAMAGTATGTTVYATENFGSASVVGDAITLGVPLTYNFSTVTAVNPGASITFVIRLTGGKWSATPAVGQVSFAGKTCVAALPANDAQSPICAFLRSTDNSTLQITVTNGALTNGTGVGATATLGLGALIFSNATIDSVNTTLNSASGVVAAQISVTTAAAATAGALDSTNALATTIDAPLASVNVATAAPAIAGVVSNLSSGLGAGNSYTRKIDVTASPPQSAYTAQTGPGIAFGNPIALGSVTFTTTAGRKQRNGTTDYDLEVGSAAASHTGSIVVTPGTGQSFVVAAVNGVFYSANLDCTGATGGVAVTAANAAAAKTLTVAAGDLTTAVPIYVCMAAPTATNIATPITATIAATALPAAALTKDASTSASGTGYSVAYNGAVVDTNGYFPGSLSQFGYQMFTRIVNTGTTSTPIQAAFIAQNTGTVGNAITLTLPSIHTGNQLAPGASVTLSNSQIDTQLGLTSANSADRPRLRITGNTSTLRVQTFIQSSNGVITEVSANN